ncbi:MAG TPA: hypothetical protein VGR28_10635 [Candidatus Thermoplasmatota archaeon]|jgi:hypothetical protein|nr:hypothetical protein [Candidatus Thermoplasmatota archaeon]
MGNALLVLEIDGASSSEDQALVNDVVAFVRQHKAGPYHVRGVLVHAGFYRAEDPQA